MGKALLSTTILALLSLSSVQAGGGDIPNSADHPLIGRFESSTISYHRVADFDEYLIFTAAPRNEMDREPARMLEGKTTRIGYRAPEVHTLVEIVRNFEMRLGEAGFEVLFSCQTQACGGTSFARAVETLPIPYMYLDPFDFRYLAARLERPKGEVYATLLASVSGNRERVFQVIVVEVEGMQYRMVEADEMAREIAAGGRVAVYGIYFDTDRTELKPESRPTIEEIVKLLRSDSSLRLIVVGHTDNQGSLEYNLDLSRRRAAAVVDELVAGHGIAADRLMSSGAAFLAPVATNDTEKGRAKNRRVELVKQ